MELLQEHIELIDKYIKADKKFVGNEDLYKEFFIEASSKVVSLLESISDATVMNTYLKKVISTSIITVLKNKGRVRRVQDNFPSENDASIDNNYPDKKPLVSDFVVDYSFIDISTSSEEVSVQKDILQLVYNAVLSAHNTNVEKQFLELFELRYVQGKKQAEIAKILNLSQSEISKRFFDLMEQVKIALGS